MYRAEVRVQWSTEGKTHGCLGNHDWVQRGSRLERCGPWVRGARFSAWVSDVAVKEYQC